MSLLPCPFCGGSAYFQTARVAEDATETWAECRMCGVRGPEVEDAYADRATAAAAWNRRTSPPEAP